MRHLCFGLLLCLVPRAGRAQDCAGRQGLPNGAVVELSKPTNGAYEHTGAGGTDHMQLSLKSAS